MKILIKRLLEKNIITQQKADDILVFEAQKPVSIFWELRTLLFLGISGLSTGLGILIYQNIDSIGHSILISVIALACLFCFYYAYKHRFKFTWGKNLSPIVLADFALLGGCVLFLTLEGYLQFQYKIFGSSYGLATFIPAILFIYFAYYFDHVGVLSMGLTALGSWMGLTMSPKNIFETFDFTNHYLIYTAIFYGLCLVVVGWFSDFKNKKEHFSFTYYLMGGNLSFVAILTALFSFETKFLFLSLLLIFSGICIFHARQTKSFLLLLMGMIYGYIGLTFYIFTNILNEISDPTIYFLYFVFSCGGVVYFLLNVKKILGIVNKPKA
jgi:hypothetical protein